MRAIHYGRPLDMEDPILKEEPPPMVKLSRPEIVTMSGPIVPETSGFSPWVLAAAVGALFLL